jgi:hypothetical protein
MGPLGEWPVFIEGGDMSNLVEPISKRTTLADCHRLVKEAHDYLSRRGTEAIEKARQVEGSPYWGSMVKRVSVLLTDENRPELVPSSVTEHSLTEVYNQCATMERLLDALEWAQTEESGLNRYEVTLCHPTTSSIPGVADDHDLVLVGPEETKAKFEVSDVAGKRDGNRKEEKDLARLGVLPAIDIQGRFEEGWPPGRVFLVVSAESARRLREPKRSWLKGDTPHCHYVEVKADGPTRVFEIRQGRRPS